MLCLLCGPAGVSHEFGFLFSLHSLKRFLLFGTQIHGSGRIVFAGLPEVTTSASSFSAASIRPASLVGFFGAVVGLLNRSLRRWWDYVGVKFFLLVRILRRFHRKYVLVLLICVDLVVLLPILLLPHQLSLLHSPFVVCIRLCILLYLRV